MSDSSSKDDNNPRMEIENYCDGPQDTHVKNIKMQTFLFRHCVVILKNRINCSFDSLT
jgi:hypothetical protein